MKYLPGDIIIGADLGLILKTGDGYYIVYWLDTLPNNIQKNLNISIMETDYKTLTTIFRDTFNDPHDRMDYEKQIPKTSTEEY